MRRILPLAAVLLALTGCAAIRDLRGDAKNPYENPFYAKYLNAGDPLDDRILLTLEQLRQDAGSPRLHNELGALLVEKGFPKDARQEFERAIDIDRKYYGAWYNLALVRAASGDEPGARRAFRQTVDLKPGHAEALFQLGLIEEQRKHKDRAIEYYAKAYRINPRLLDVGYNPQILDTKLTHMALLTTYPVEHAKESMNLADAPVVYVPRKPAEPLPAPSDVPPPQQIVPPAPPPTDPSMQQQPGPATVPTFAAPQSDNPRPTRRRRPRRVQPQETPQQQPAETTEQPAAVEEPAPFNEPVDPNAPPPPDEEQDSIEIPPDQIPPTEDEPPPPGR